MYLRLRGGYVRGITLRMTQRETATAEAEPTKTHWTPAAVLEFASDAGRWMEERRGGAKLMPISVRIPQGATDALRAVAPPHLTLGEVIRGAIRREALRLSRMAVRRAEAKKEARNG